MGFYGNLSNSARTQLYFDRIYSNRKEMEDNIETDGVFVGRYVLVEYGQDTSRDGYLKVFAIEDCVSQEGYYAYLSSDKNPETKLLLKLDDEENINPEDIKQQLEDLQNSYNAAIKRKQDLEEIISDYDISIKNYKAQRNELQKRYDTIVANGSNTNPTILEKLDMYNQAIQTVEDQKTIIRLQEAVIEECNRILENNPDDVEALQQLQQAQQAKEAAENRKTSAENTIRTYEIDLKELLEVQNELADIDIQIRNNQQIKDAYLEQLEDTKKSIESTSKEILRLQNKYNAAVRTDGLVVKIDDKIYYVDGITGRDNFYICVGKDEDGYAIFKLLTVSSNDTYMENYNIDRLAFGSDKSYDSTVWRKSFKNNKEYYLMIAELNTKTPSFGITVDAPTMAPIPPHFGTDSNNMNYNLHMQPSWGLRVKEANIDEYGSDGVELPSDEIVTRVTSEYDQNAGVIHHKTEKVNGAIFYNKDGFDIQQSNHSDILDSIQVKPTGKSGKEYNVHIGDHEDNKNIDIYEMSMMLPTIGNSVASLYDLAYGVNDLTKKRYLDVEWKDATDKTLKTGDLNIGGATRNLSTIAGCINSAHDLMGMIIIEKDSALSQEEVNDADPSKIYNYNNNYYIKHETYDYTEVEYQYEVINLDEDTYSPHTYYIKDGDNYIMSSSDFNSNIIYYQKTFSGALDKINLLSYQKDRYYYKDKNLNYILDTNENFSDNFNYYDISVLDIELTPYKPYVYYSRLNGNYYLETNDTFNDSIPYFTITDVKIVNKPFYQPRKYFYVDENTGKTYLDTSRDFTPDRIYYTEVTGSIEVDESTGEINPSAVVIEDSKIDLIGFEYNKYYYRNANDYFVLQDIDYIDKDQTYFTIKTFLFTGDFYVSDFYYYKDGNNYLLDTDLEMTPDREYAIIENETLLDKFYRENIYYYVNEYGKLVLDTSSIMTEGRQYYIKHKYYIMDDLLNKLNIGSIWNENITAVPASIKIGDRHSRYEMIPLVEYADKNSTINGIIVELKNLIENNDKLSRKNTTLSGTLNLLNDKLNQFEDFKPGQILLTDIYGRVNTVKPEEDTWLSVKINPYGVHPRLIYTHKDANVDNNTTTVTGNETPNFGATFKIPEISYDLKGHISGINTHTVKVPLPSLKDDKSNNADVITQLSLTAETGALATTRTNIGNLLITGYTKANTKQELLATDSLNVALGKLEKNIEQEESDRKTAINNLDYADQNANTTQFVSKVTETDGIISVERANAGGLLITGYSKAANKATILATDSLNIALGKLEKNIEQEESDRKAAINNLDYQDQNANTTQFVSKVTETDGVISVERANAGGLLITGYNKATKKSSLLATDSLNIALGKLEKNIEQEETDRKAAINDLDYSDPNFNTTQFVSKVTETDGKITVERANAGGLVLTGYTSGTTGEILATDNINNAFSKLQTQVSTLKTEVETENTGLLDRVSTIENSDYTSITQQDIDNWNSYETNVQSDWNIADSNSDAFIKNKPNLSNMVETTTKFNYTYNSTTTQKTIQQLYDYISDLELRIYNLENPAPEEPTPTIPTA